MPAPAQTAGMSTLIATAAIVLALSKGEPLNMPEDPAGDPCGANRLSHLVGAPLPDIETLDTPGRVRVIRPGDRVTMDMLPDRLNIHLDEDDIVVQLRCG